MYLGHPYGGGYFLERVIQRLLEYHKNEYRITSKRPFHVDGEMSYVDINECFEFAYEMTFGEGEHRNTRSGGERKRRSGEIFTDTFQGKLAEYAMYRYLLQNEIYTTKPDLKIEGRGVWDSFDLEYGGLHISVKSTKEYGNLLLLETKDWDENGIYIPNKEDTVNTYDMFVLLRISPNGEQEMKHRGLLYADKIDKMILRDMTASLKWKYNIAGCILHEDFLELIRKKYILPKGAKLGSGTYMDAENYYIQSGDLRSSKELIWRLKKYTGI